ncbi:MAG TPA: sigma-54-dependent Fis family transcriptional regulator [Terriglobia bacterium]|nr:sigma-54-dependent Fis family transcriptional regulator [Terriglobia bacterium]
MSAEANNFNVEELTLLYRVARTLLGERDYGELLAALLDVTIEGLAADRGFVVVREGAAGEAKFRAAVARNFKSEALARTEEEVSGSISAAVVESGRAMRVGDALASERFGENPSVKRLGLRSVLCAPLVVSNQAFALIYLENRDVTNRFTERQRELLDEICRLAAPRLRTAVAIELARKHAREMESGLGETDGIVTADAGMAEVLKTVRQVAPTELAVLIQGETGTGKELMARALYRHSARAQGPFVVLNCGAIPASLIESELFGTVRGAYTGANRDRVGLIAAAHRGTFFLDEVGELPPELQPRLLRVLQSGEFTRLGSVRAETVDVRFVAATNKDLAREVEEGRFRSDLFYRISGITLKIPPLRERPHDVQLLADQFLRDYAARYARRAPHLSGDCLAVLSAYTFPGNVRELESEIARLVAVSPPGATIESSALNERILGLSPTPAAMAAQTQPRAQTLAPMSLAEMEKRLILAVLEHTGGNRTRAAEVLGISREGLRTKMQRLGVSEGAAW